MNQETLPFLLDVQLNGIWGFKVFPYNILYFFGVCLWCFPVHLWFCGSLLPCGSLGQGPLTLLTFLKNRLRVLEFLWWCCCCSSFIDFFLLFLAIYWVWVGFYFNSCFSKVSPYILKSFIWALLDLLMRSLGHTSLRTAANLELRGFIVLCFHFNLVPEIFLISSLNFSSFSNEFIYLLEFCWLLILSFIS